MGEATQPKAPARLSPQARDKLSRLAKERHAAGRFGGAKHGALGGRGNTREKRMAAQAVAEDAATPETQRKILDVLHDAIDPSQNIGVRLAGVKQFHEIEKDHKKFEQAQAAAESQERSREELLSLLSTKLRQGPVAGILRRQLEQENIPDAEVVEEIVDDGDAANE